MEGREELIVYKIISEPLIQGFEPQPHFRFVVINHQNGEPYPVWHATPQYAKFFADEETLNRILPTLKDLLMITESDDVKVTTVGDVYKLLTEALTQKIEYYKYELKKDAQILSEMG